MVLFSTRQASGTAVDRSGRGESEQESKTMKRNLLLLFLSLIALPLFAQGLNFWNRCGDTFDQRFYPTDSFAVKRQSIAFGHTQIVITVLHYNFQEEDQVWIAQRRKKRILHSKYLGGISSGENGVTLPDKQILEDFFIIKYASEFTGIYFLISKTGSWYEIPGGGIILNKELNTLYTYVPVECGGCQIGKFSLATRKIITKPWDGQGVAWAEIKEPGLHANLFAHSIWIKWNSH